MDDVNAIAILDYLTYECASDDVELAVITIYSKAGSEITQFKNNVEYTMLGTNILVIRDSTNGVDDIQYIVLSNIGSISLTIYRKD